MDKLLLQIVTQHFKITKIMETKNVMLFTEVKVNTIDYIASGVNEDGTNRAATIILNISKKVPQLVQKRDEVTGKPLGADTIHVEEKAWIRIPAYGLQKMLEGVCYEVAEFSSRWPSQYFNREVWAAILTWSKIEFEHELIPAGTVIDGRVYEHDKYESKVIDLQAFDEDKLAKRLDKLFDKEKARIDEAKAAKDAERANRKAELEAEAKARQAAADADSADAADAAVMSAEDVEA